MKLEEARQMADDRQTVTGVKQVVYRSIPAKLNGDPAEFNYCSVAAWRTQAMFASCDLIELR